MFQAEDLYAKSRTYDAYDVDVRAASGIPHWWSPQSHPGKTRFN